MIAWNQELQTVLTAPGAQPASIHPTRTMALTQVDGYDAVAGILRDGQALLVSELAPRHASADAAAAAAARTVLDALLPTQHLRSTRSASALAQLGSGDGSGAGCALGPGRQRGSRLGPMTAGTRPARVRAARAQASSGRAPPPALTSPRYAADFAEVHALGALNGSTRSADQTAIGQFWGAAPIWIVWNQIADQAAVGFHDSVAQNARLFALLDTSLADGAVALYDAKYTFHRWRPITAITAADQGNPNTTADPNWLPLANTANDPSYPGAHAEFSQAAARCCKTSWAPMRSRSR